MVSLEELDNYLASEATPDDCLMLSDLDGFLHGIACSPVFIQPEEWVPVALGGHMEDQPGWVIAAMMVLYADILDGLAKDPPEVEPLFWEREDGHVIAMDWCEGFMKAVSLRPKDWLRLSESGSHGPLLTPILVHLIDEEGNSVMGIPQEELDEALEGAAEAIPTAVAGIYRFWQEVS